MGVTNHLLNGMILKKSDALKKVVTPKTPDLESQGHFSGKKKTYQKFVKKLKRLPKLPIKPRHFIAVQPFVFWGKKNVGNFHGGVVKTVHIQPSVKELGKSELYVDVFFAILAKGRKGNLKRSEVCLSVKIKAKKNNVNG